MIICRTPFRVSFFGGGTDLPEYFQKNRGAVIGTAIDKYIYHTISKFPSKLFDYNTKISYSKVECVKSIDDLTHIPFREILRATETFSDVEIHIAADLPSYSGLGSSSSFTVGLLKAIHEFKNSPIDAFKLAKEAIRIEREILHEAVGCQDQTFAAYGGMNLIRFESSNKIIVEPLNLSASTMEELSASLILFFTGITRRAATIESEKIKQISAFESNYESMLTIVDEAYALLKSGSNLAKFGELLHQAWNEKKALANGVTNLVIDEIYETGIKNGALGGKLLGAGGGGFMLFFVQPDNRERLKKALYNLSEIPFTMDAPGATIIYS